MEIYNFTDEKKSILESLPQPLAVYQYVDNRIVALIISDGFCKMFGYTDRAQAYHDLNHDMFRFDHPDDVSRVAKAAEKFATEGGVFDVIYRSRSRNSSEYRIIHGYGNHVYEENNTRLAYIWYIDEGVYEENSGDQESAFRRSVNNALHEESILKASQYDSLTGLPNMTYFFQIAEAAKRAYQAKGKEAILLYFDLNGMKFFNTKHSYAEGDKLLKSFGNLLLRTFGSDCCCHIGADHFAAYTGEDGVEELVQELFHECRELNGGNSLPVRIGIYSSRMEDVPVSTACDRAKYACDMLRNTYESSFSYFNDSMRNFEERRQYILSHLDQAIEENWIQVYFQPIVRAVTGKASDEEALARWIDPVMGFLNPAEFIPYLEDAGVIYKLDLHVVDLVLEKIKKQKEAGMFVVPQSVNLSRSDFDGCDIVEEIRSRVDAAGIPREKITIEITESTIGSDFDFMRDQVARFRELGFPVWMDDFGSGYSSLDVLQLIKFDLLKFDMSFMKRLNEGENGKIILTELIKMASALGVETACEGVETEEQVHFLREIGCSKLQGFYFSKPTPFEKLMEIYAQGMKVGYENPDESDYYETIGRVNLHDLAVIVNEEENVLQNFFNTLPICILEIKDNCIRYIRVNQSYRDFTKRFFGVDVVENVDIDIPPADINAPFTNLIKQCCSGSRAIVDEQMQDGSLVHSFARRLGTNAVTGWTAIAVAVLSITDTSEGATYAGIARALAADYYNIYYVDLNTDQFIEYSSPVGGEELAMERHGENFFESAKRDTMVRIYEEDREPFLSGFSKENILRELDAQGVFTATYRLIDTGTPMYANMKIMRMLPDRNHLIIGISIVDSQMKQQEEADRLQMEKNAYDRVMALTGDYLTLYTIDPENGSYVEYSATDEYEKLGLAKSGENFFAQGIIDGKKAVYPEDLPVFLDKFSRENILQEIRENGQFSTHYRLMIDGVPKHVSLKIVSVREKDGEKLIAGVRAWKERR